MARYGDLLGLATTTAYGYSAEGQVTNLHHQNALGTTLAHYTFSYDAQGRLTSEARDGVTKTYSYDDTDQLTGDGTATYTYDANGNRTMAGYQTGAGNRLESDGTWTYGYDAEGNLTGKTLVGPLQVRWSYGYDH